MSASVTRSRKWLAISAVLLAAVLASGGLLFWRAQHVANLLRPWVIRSLSEHFQSRVELSNLRVSGFPLLSVTAADLSIHFDD